MRGRRKIREERERVARAIGLIVLGVAPLGAFSQACSSPDAAAMEGDGGEDSGGEASDFDVQPAGDGHVISNDEASCAITATPFDAGRLFDAEGGGIDLSCTYDLPCGPPPSMLVIDCEAFYGQPDGSADSSVAVGCTVPEGLGCTDGSFTPGPRGEFHMTCLDCFGGGRRPRGLRKTRVSAKTPLGAYFARMAHDEAASVLAFDRMLSELRAFSAPRDLRVLARKARRDEVSHARVMRKLTTAHGAAPKEPRLKKARPRSLAAMAIENIVEGCVNETFGAILLAWQSRSARSEALRTTLRKIARDEAEHAALAWSVAAWADSRLDVASRSRVRRARDRAMGAIIAAAHAPKILDGDREVGLPNARERRALVAGFVASFGAENPARPLQRT